MGAQMTSGKMRSMARKINLKSASNIEGIRFISKLNRKHNFRITKSSTPSTESTAEGN